MYEDLEDMENFEDELAYEDELGGLLEDGEMWEDLEDEYSYEDEAGLFESWEDMETDGYFEADPFIGKLVKKAGRVIKKAARGPVGGVLKNLAKQAAQVAGGAIGGPAGAKIASTIANQVIRESEEEGEWGESYETDPESDLEVMGGDLEIFEEMEYLAALASETDNEEEADQFIGAIANLAGPLLSSLMGETDHEDPELWEDGEGDQFLPLIGLAAKAIPLVAKGVRAVGKAMNASRQTRKMVRTLPRVTAKTATSLARQARAGRPITPQRVARTMARQTAKTLVKRPTVATAMSRNRANARRRVQAKGPAVRVPVGRPGIRSTVSPLRGRPVPVRPAVVRRAVAGPVGMAAGAPSYGGMVGYAVPRGRRGRVIRPRYCVY